MTRAVLNGLNVTGLVGLGRAAVSTQQLTVQGQATTDKVLVVQGVASQSGDLQQWQNSGGTVVAKVVPDGGATFNGTLNVVGAGMVAQYEVRAGNVASLGAVCSQPWVASFPAAVFRAHATQSVNILECQASGGGLLMGVTEEGKLKFAAANAATTVGAAGGASALPATPTKYFLVKDSAGTTLKIPAYAT